MGKKYTNQNSSEKSYYFGCWYLLAVCHLLSRKLLELDPICLKNAFRKFHTKSTDKTNQNKLDGLDSMSNKSVSDDLLLMQTDLHVCEELPKL